MSPTWPNASQWFSDDNSPYGIHGPCSCCIANCPTQAQYLIEGKHVFHTNFSSQKSTTNRGDNLYKCCHTHDDWEVKTCQFWRLCKLWRNQRWERPVETVESYGFNIREHTRRVYSGFIYSHEADHAQGEYISSHGSSTDHRSFIPSAMTRIVPWKARDPSSLGRLHFRNRVWNWNDVLIRTLVSWLDRWDCGVRFWTS